MADGLSATSSNTSLLLLLLLLLPSHPKASSNKDRSGSG
jgi:hypothetical protein